MTGLDEHLMGDEPDWTAQPEPLRDELEVDRYLRRYQSIRAMRQAADDLAATRKAEIDDWRHHTQAKLDHQLDWLAQSIEGWARASRDEKAKRLSFSFPSGTIKTTKQGGKFTIVSDDEFVGWARGSTPSLLRTPVPKTVPDLTAIKERFAPLVAEYETTPPAAPRPPEPVKITDRQTGEVVEVPGLVYDPTFIRVTIEVPKIRTEDDSENDSQ